MSDFNYKDYLRNNPLLQKEVKEEKLLTESQEIEEKVEESAPGYTHDCAAHVMHESHGYGLCLEGRHTLVETTDGNAEVTHYDVMFKSGEIVEKIPVSELKVITSESHTHSKYEEDDVEIDENEEVTEELNSMEQEKVMDALNNYIAEFRPDFGKVSEIADMLSELTGISSTDIHNYLIQLTGGDDEMRFNEGIQKKVPSTKIKVSELKAKIKEDILSILSEQEDEEEVEDEVEVDMDMDVEEPTSAPAGLSQDEQEIQDSLKVAYDNAVAIGDEKLADQIGNSITFFTRTHVVER